MTAPDNAKDNRTVSRWNVISYSRFVCVLAACPDPRLVLGYHTVSLQEKHQAQRTHNAQSHDRPSGGNDLLVRELGADVPDQMSDAVEAVEGKGNGEEGLDQHFHHEGQGGEAGSERGRLEVPANQGRHEIGRTEDVQGA